MQEDLLNSTTFDDPLCGAVRILRSDRSTFGMSLAAGDGPLLLRVPRRCSSETARRFLTEHAEWVRRTREKLRRRAVEIPPLEFCDGAIFYRLGHPFRLLGADRNEFSADGILRVAAHSEALIRPCLKRLYAAEALRYLRNRTRELAAKFEFEYASVAVNSAAGRWGSCSSGGKLHFSWRLYMCEPRLVDHVVLHELAHTVEMNHSERFWALMTRCDPETPILRRRLAEAGKRYPIW